jgi:hypothetical protein
MAAKLTSLTEKIAIQVHLVAESCTICCSRWPVRKLLDTPSYVTMIMKDEWDENWCGIFSEIARKEERKD